MNQQLRTLERLSSLYPERSDEIQSLIGFLAPGCPLSILILGGSGLGKTEIVTASIREIANPLCDGNPSSSAASSSSTSGSPPSPTPLPVASLFCKGFGSSKHLFRALYHAISSSINSSANSGNSQKPAGDPSNVVNKRLKKKQKSAIPPINSFSDLCEAISKLFRSMKGTQSTNTIEISAPMKRLGRRLYLLLDCISEVDSLEHGLSRKLLSLGKLCREGLKVVAISRSLHDSSHSGEGRTRQSIHNHAIGIPPDCLPLHFLPYSDVQILQILKRRARRHFDSSPEDLASFDSMAKATLPRLFLATRHIDELWSALLAAWEHTETAARAEAAPGRKSIGQGHANSIAVAFVRELILRPVVRLSCDELGLADDERERDREWDKADTDGFRHGHGQEGSAVGVLIGGSLRGRTWAEDLPLSTRYLLLAAHIASKNPAETDHSTLGSGSKGTKRKHGVASGGPDDESAILGQSKTASNLQNREKPFSLERLLSIYMVIVSRCLEVPLDEKSKKLQKRDKPAIRAATAPPPAVGKGIEAETASNSHKIVWDYGDTQLFVTVNSLVTKNLLIRTADWTPSNPLFFCSVSSQAAEQIAKTVRFPLNDFLLY